MVESVFANAWGFPGGGVEVEEEIFEGLVREFYEETGYRVRVVGVPTHVCEGWFFHEDLGFCHSFILIFNVELADSKRDEQVVNTFEDGFEIRQGQWINPRSLKEEDVHPVFWPFVQSWQEQHGKIGYHKL